MKGSAVDIKSNFEGLQEGNNNLIMEWIGYQNAIDIVPHSRM